MNFWHSERPPPPPKKKKWWHQRQRNHSKKWKEKRKIQNQLLKPKDVCRWIQRKFWNDGTNSLLVVLWHEGKFCDLRLFSRMGSVFCWASSKFLWPLTSSRGCYLRKKNKNIFVYSKLFKSLASRLLHHHWGATLTITRKPLLALFS